MSRRKTRHHHSVEARQLAIAVLVGCTIVTLSGCGGGGWSKSLYAAAQNGYINTAERYLEQGESIDAAHAEDGRTPLHAAAERGHKKMSTFLLDHGAFINPRDNEGNTPLHLAAAAGHDGTVRVLLADGADPTIRNNAGETPRDLATRHPEVTRDLRNAGG